MKIIIKTPLGKKTSLEVKSSDTIRSVKRKYQDAEGIPPDNTQCLLFPKRYVVRINRPTVDIRIGPSPSKRRLDENKTLRDCNIRRDSVIYYVPKRMTNNQ